MAFSHSANGVAKM
ncbi:hypothetical protein M1V39_24575 [Escherichia coli]|nr:hypothetical protein [Escherichia coli]MCO4907476.1 hypothetical protein [Escherichia coli]MCO4907477.1 hypothetical protein [Escherichia coli]